MVTTANSSVALGYGTTLTEDNVVSVGSESSKRRIVNVADGTAANNAATVGQTVELEAGDNVTVTENGTNSSGQKIYRISASSTSGTGSDLGVLYDADSNKAKVTLAGADGTVITNVKAGTVSETSTDAVNGSQLYAEQTAREGAVTSLTNTLNTEVGKLTAKDTEIEGKVSDLNTALTNKAGELAAKDTEIEGKVTAETTARSEADAALGARIDSVNNSINTINGSAMVYDADSNKTKVTLAGADGTVITNVKAGAVSETSTDAVNGSQLYAEQAARSGADTTLQSNIDAEKTAREGAITAVTNTLNTEVGKLTAKDTEIEGKVSDLNTALTTKASELSAKDTEIEGKVTAETNARSEAVAALGARIDSVNSSINTINGSAMVYDADSNKAKVTLAGADGTVITNVKAGAVSEASTDAVNGSQLYAEQAARSGADTTLQGNIDAEKTAREGAINTVTNALNTEVDKLTAKDTEIEGKVSDLNTALTNKAGELAAKDTEIEGKVTAETTARSEADAALGARIDSVNNSINTINGSAMVYDADSNKAKVTLAGADGTVITNVKAGTVSETSTDAVNGSQLYAEQTAREGAVTSLTNTLNTEVGKLTAKDTEIEGKVSDLNTALTNKAGELAARDTEIEGKVTAETTARSEADAALGARIDSVNSSINAINGSAMVYDADSNKAKVTLAGADGTVITNVKAGAVSEASTDAVNGSQLYAEQIARVNKDLELTQVIAKEVANRENAVSNLRTELTGYVNGSLENVISYADAAKDRVSFGGANGTLLTNLKDGTVASGSTDAVTGGQLYDEVKARKDAVSDINSRLNVIEVSSNNAVSYDDADKTSISLKGTDGTVIKNVSGGVIAEGSMEAVNGGQLYDEAEARKAADDAIRAEFGNRIAGINDSAVSYDDVSDKSAVSFKGEDGTVLKNVGNGDVSKESMEAVNGRQLFETNTKLEALTDKVGTTKDGTYVKENSTVGENINSLDEAVAANSDAIGELGSRVSSGFNILGRKINNTGAHAAALAALNPVAEDDSKFSFAAGIGSYHNARAGAIGMFYRPSDRYQFSIGGTTGNGEHMYNLGFAVGLDKNVGGPFANKKAMIREIVNLRDERDAQNAYIGVLSKRLDEQDKKIAELSAKLAKVLG